MVAAIIIGVMITLLILSLVVLEKYRDNEHTTKIFISIPITGMEKTVRQRLKRAISYVDNFAEYLGGSYRYVYDSDLDRFDENGEYPGLSQDVSYDEQLKRDIEVLKTSDVVVMTPGWKESHGCMDEFNLANEMGKLVIIINDFDYAI